MKVNTQAAKARIEDADFAAETSKMTKVRFYLKKLQLQC